MVLTVSDLLMASFGGIQDESAQVELCFLETRAERDKLLLLDLIWDREILHCSNEDDFTCGSEKEVGLIMGHSFATYCGLYS